MSDVEELKLYLTALNSPPNVLRRSIKYFLTSLVWKIENTYEIVLENNTLIL